MLINILFLLHGEKPSVTGSLEDFFMNYQVMLVNGFNQYERDGGVFSGKSGLRSGRQKHESYMTDIE